MIKIFTIKGRNIEVITLADGRRAPTPESCVILHQLTLQYSDSLQQDQDALAFAKYIKEGK